jgi:microcystin-dependent protein
MTTPFLAQIEIFSFNFAPKGWAQCNGQLLPINQNQALFSLLGTTYGGDGRVNFGLPDLRSRVPVYYGGNGVSVIGQRGGEESHQLTVVEMALHIHSMNASNSAATTATPSNGTALASAAGTANPGGSFNISLYSTATSSEALSAQSMTNTGGNQTHENRMPFLALNMCIALQGSYPSQN